MFKRLLIIPFLITLAACASHYNVTGMPPTEQQIHYHPPVPESWDLPNGLKILYLEDSELPLVDAVLAFPGGSYYESSSEVGLSSAFGDLQRAGGAGNLSGDALDLELEKIGATIRSDMNQEFGKVDFSCLSGDLDRVFSIFADVVFHPRFDQKQLDLYKGNLLEGISRRVEEPSSVITLSFLKLAYGDSPYGRVVMKEDVAGITRERLQQIHSKFVRPTGAVFAISGNIKRERVQALVDKYFKNWRDDGKPLAKPPALQAEPTPGIYFIELPFAQANIYAGELGVARHTPDEFAINGFNYVFGGSVDSELFRHVRTTLGLAYDVEGAISASLDRGINVISLSTKSETVDVALSESLKVLSNMRAGNFPAERVSDMKRSVSSSFVFNFASPAAIVKRRAGFLLYGYPENYDLKYLDETEKLTPQDLIKVANARWDFNKFVIVIVGNHLAFERIESLMKAPPVELQGLKLQKVKFSDRLEVP